MTITQADSFYVEKFHKEHTAECNNEIKVSRTHQSHHPAKTFYIASDKHDESVLAGKF